jgi:hypothetical protein
MSEIYIAPGHISAHDLLSTASYAVSAWPIQTDQEGIDWIAATPSLATQGLTQSLAGSGKYTGALRGTIEFLGATPLMREYLYNELFDGEPFPPATVQIYHALYGWSVWQVRLTEPFANASMAWQPNDVMSNLALEFSRGRRMPLDTLLLQSGNNLLFQDDLSITLESA